MSNYRNNSPKHAGPNLRRRMLAKIHILKKDKGLDDDTYRLMLERLTGHRSASKLDIDGLHIVLDHLNNGGNTALKRNRKRARKAQCSAEEGHQEEQGGKVESDQKHPLRSDRPHNFNCKQRGPSLRKIEAMLRADKRPWGYANTIAKRVGKVADITFCDNQGLRKVIAALTYDKKRRANKAKANTTPKGKE